MASGIIQPGEGGGGRGAQGRAAPTTAGLAPVSMLMFAPRSVMALAVGLVEVTVAPASIESVPTPSLPVPSAFRSAPRLRCSCRCRSWRRGHRQVRSGRDVDLGVRRAALDVAQRQAPQAVEDRRCWADSSCRSTTFCWAVLALSANWMRLLLVPIGPLVFSVTVAPVVAISAAVLLALAATMPPVPAVRLIVPPLPFSAVPRRRRRRG